MNGKILKKTTASVSQTATLEDINGNKFFNFGNGKYFDIGTSIQSRGSRTFILQATLLEGVTKIQFIDAGYDSDGCLFSLGWGYSSNQMFYHFSYDDNTNLYQLASPGSYMLAFVYNGENEMLYIYVNGELVHSSSHYLYTGSTSYRIGNFGPDTPFGSIKGEWKSKFGIVYNRALSADEIKSFTRFGIIKEKK